MKIVFKNIIQQISKSKIVSFDIFDTLLLRPFCRPIDLFYYLEELEKCPDFAISRIEAEKKALKNSPFHDVNLDEIYTFIPSFSNMKEKEIELEKKYLIINPSVKKIWNYAKKNKKKIIIISDMYLPSNIIKEILVKNGYKGYIKLYVSNEYHERKDNGKLFKRVLSDLKVSGKDLLHIGDNPYSDVKMAKKYKIKTVLIPNLTQQTLTENPAIRNFLFPNYSIQKSFFIGNLIIGWEIFKQSKDNIGYWDKIGYFYGGILHYFFAKWIYEKSQEKNISKLLFVARDGYTTQKIFEKLFPSISSQYFYAPRFVSMLIRKDFGKIPEVQKERIKALLHFINKEGTFLSDTRTQNFQLQFDKYSQIELHDYKKYIDSLNLKNENIGLIDSVSASFSAQKLLESICPNKITGFYVNALLNYKEILTFFCKSFSCPFCHFIEFLMAAPEKPIERIKNNKPVYKQNLSTFEKIKIDIYPQIFVSSFASAIFLHEKKISFNSKMVYEWLNNFYYFPNKQDITNMEKIKNGVDLEHTTYKPIFTNWYRFKKRITKIYIFKIHFYRVFEKFNYLKREKFFYFFNFCLFHKKKELR